MEPMISISVAKQPFLDARDSITTAGKYVSKQIDEFKTSLQNGLQSVSSGLNISPAKAAFYASVAANLCAYSNFNDGLGGYSSLSTLGFSALQLAFNGLDSKAKAEGSRTEADARLRSLGVINFKVNFTTSLFNMPKLKLIATLFNSLSDTIQVNWK